MMSDVAEAPVIFAVRGHLGHILLNRPRAINALNYEMVVSIRSQLDAWATDDSVQTIAVSGSGERGLCAGGDIVSLYKDATTGDGAASARFWRDEYALNLLIANYPKPYVALMDGVVLGGGIGISAHGSHRVVTERSKLGMPETGIGFVPDVGGTWLLSRAPGETGTFVALTAGSITGADAIAMGIADSFVPSSELGSLLESLETLDADAAIAALAQEPPVSRLVAADRSWIDTAFAGDSVAVIVERLRESSVADANGTAEVIMGKSPTALAVTLESLRRAARLPTLEAVITQEFRVSLRAFAAPDFAEGVRAQVIDRDRTPHWDPASLDEIDAQFIDTFFAPLSGSELG